MNRLLSCFSFALLLLLVSCSNSDKSDPVGAGDTFEVAASTQINAWGSFEKSYTDGTDIIGLGLYDGSTSPVQLLWARIKTSPLAATSLRYPDVPDASSGYPVELKSVIGRPDGGCWALVSFRNRTTAKPDGQVFQIDNNGTRVRIIELSVAQVNRRPGAMCLTPNGDLRVFGDDNDENVLWSIDTKTFKVTKTVTDLYGVYTPLLLTSIGPNNVELLSNSSSGNIFYARFDSSGYKSADYFPNGKLKVATQTPTGNYLGVGLSGETFGLMTGYALYPASKASYVNNNPIKNVGVSEAIWWPNQSLVVFTGYTYKTPNQSLPLLGTLIPSKNAGAPTFGILDYVPTSPDRSQQGRSVIIFRDTIYILGVTDRPTNVAPSATRAPIIAQVSGTFRKSQLREVKLVPTF